MLTNVDSKKVGQLIWPFCHWMTEGPYKLTYFSEVINLTHGLENGEYIVGVYWVLEESWCYNKNCITMVSVAVDKSSVEQITVCYI